MAPPPATPALSKFLPPKRRSTAAQTRSQPAFSQQPLPNPPQQFQTTPRFSLSAATHPPSSLTTPSTLRIKTRTVYDPIESPPGSSDSPPASYPAFPPSSPAGSFPGPAAETTTNTATTTWRARSDSIESVTALVSQSPPGEQQQRDGPSRKRRRVSVPQEAVDASPYERASGGRSMPSGRDGPLSRPSGNDDDEAGSPVGSGSSSGPSGEPHTDAGSSPSRRAGASRPQVASSRQYHFRLQRQPQRPAVNRAPRFKASEVSATRPQYFLPDAFSPQRRGAKYLPGGLAAELRDWLVEVKGEAGIGGMDARDKSSAAAACPVVEVCEARPSSGMWLVKGHRRVPQPPATAQAGEVRVILAGEGRLSGLARVSEVAPGRAVQILPPTWDIHLGDGKWLVACDWRILDEDIT